VAKLYSTDDPSSDTGKFIRVVEQEVLPERDKRSTQKTGGSKLFHKVEFEKERSYTMEEIISLTSCLCLPLCVFLNEEKRGIENIQGIGRSQ